MKTLSVAEFKAWFSEVLEKVQAGESIGISYGKKKEPFIVIVPFTQKKRGKRKIGLLDETTEIKFADDFKMTEEELAGLK